MVSNKKSLSDGFAGRVASGTCFFIYNKVNPGSVETFLLVTVVTFCNRYVCQWIVYPFRPRKKQQITPGREFMLIPELKTTCLLELNLVYTNIFFLFYIYTHTPFL